MRLHQRGLLSILLLIALATATHVATSTSLSAYSNSPQYVDGRFRNLDPDRQPAPNTPEVGWWDVFFNKPENTIPAAPIQVRSITRGELDSAPERSAYRLGHSTLLLKLRGQWWLTDPVFSDRASPVQWAGPSRFHAPPIALDALPTIRGVLISHDHYDHLDSAAVRALSDRGTRFYVPLGVGDRLRSWGVPASQVQEFDWWQSTEVGGLRITSTPAQHFSGRTLSDRNKTLWTSWVVEDGPFRMFFSGDTGYFSGFKAIGERLGPFAVTFIETGAYNANWPNVHMQPEETVEAHKDLRGEWLVPIHNGTFSLAMHAWDEPLERVTAIARARGVRITTPAFGERVELQSPHAANTWWRPKRVPAETAVRADGSASTAAQRSWASN
ncbi:MBL fold metallo-hydrolase [Lysobacter sp. 2RAF19]